MNPTVKILAHGVLVNWPSGNRSWWSFLNEEDSVYSVDESKRIEKHGRKELLLTVALLELFKQDFFAGVKVIKKNPAWSSYSDLDKHIQECDDLYMAERFFKILVPYFEFFSLKGSFNLVAAVSCDAASEKEIIYFIHNGYFDLDRDPFFLTSRIVAIEYVKRCKKKKTVGTLIPHFDKLHKYEKDIVELILENHAIEEQDCIYVRDFVRTGTAKNLYFLEDNNCYCVAQIFDTYMANCRKLGVEPNFSGNFLRKFGNVAIYAEELKIKTNAEKFKISQLEKGISWHYNGYCAVVPTSIQELQDEGEQQHNCVAEESYYEDVAAGITGMIVFIRREDKPEKSYITVEVDTDGRILQFLEAFNKEGDEELLDAFQNYLDMNW